MVVLCLVGVLWVPIMKEVQGGQLFIYIQAVSSYLSPPIAAVYLIALFWKRSNEAVYILLYISAIYLSVYLSILFYFISAIYIGTRNLFQCYYK